MGSEHYCLRWNNHQSNLLGVFSQLLQDESLVDVTLACSEGASIRAHKVVLSACSSYFQTLFLDHPARHPIVILKDVRFAELRTLVDFMYKGEVNVEYCQLSALLKTAESLKVKGLAEMTNQNTPLAEPKREPDRLRPHSHSSAHASATNLTSATSPSSSSLVIPTSTGTTIAGGGAGGSSSSGTAHSPHHPHHHPSLGSPTSNAAASIVAAAASLGIKDLSTMTKSRGLDPDGRSPSPSPPSPTPLALYPRSRDHPSGSISSLATTTITTAAAERRSSEERDLAEHHQAGSRPLSNSGTANAFSSSTLNSLSSTVERLNNSNNATGMSSSNDSGNLRLRQRRDDGSDDDDDDDDEDMEENGSALAHEASGTTINSKQDQLLQHCQRTTAGEDDGRRSSTNNNNNNNNSDDEYEPPIKIKSEVEFSPLSGLNMTINSPACLANSTTSSLVNSSAIGDLRPSSRDSGRGGGTPVACSSTTVQASSGGGNGSAALALDRSSPRSQRDRNERSTFGSGGIPSPLSEPIAGPSGMGPVQQVPLSLKKEIDWDRGDDKSSGDSSLDFRHPHDSEASEPHAASGSVGGGGGIIGGGLCPSGSGHLGVPSPLGGVNSDGGPGPIYPCMYCGATFPHQSKLTRHILSHSLETLKYRETAHLIHPSHLALLQQQHHELTQQAQHQQAAQAAAAAAAASLMPTSPSPSALSSPHFGGAGPLRTGPGPLDQILEPPDGASPMELEFAAAVAAAAASGNAGAAGVLGGGGDQGNVVLCKFCGKSFPDVSSLITHLPVHTGDRPFKCEFCGKAFKLRHHMKDHCRVHTGERPFRCGMCGKTFSRSTILKAHEKTHYPKYVRKFLSPSPIDGKDDSPQ